MEILYQVSLGDIQTFLSDVDSAFEPTLSERVNLREYSTKLLENSHVIGFKEADRLISAIFYYTDAEKKSVYIPVLGSVASYEGKGLMRVLMDKLEVLLIEDGYISLNLETWLGGRALNIYVKRGFQVTSVAEKKIGNRTNVMLRKNLNKEFPFFSFSETAIETNNRLNDELGINLFIKRDDLFPVTGGGSKARKLKFILKKAISLGCTAVVTAGSNHSNHLRATALLCAELGLKFTACVHDERPQDQDIKGNLKLTLNLAHRYCFVEMQDIKNAMDTEINKYILEGEKPLYIWGGGHSIEGTYSYYHAIQNALRQIEVIPDYIYIASGTGTTQAGIILGIKKYNLSTKVIGISVAREEERGKSAIEEAITHIQPYMGFSDIDASKIIFNDQFLMGGYGNSNLELDEFLKTIAKNYGLVLDPIYSGKAFYGLWNHIKSGIIKEGSNVLFWNTGGILNIK